MSANLAALMLFLTLTGAMGLGYLAFAGQPSSKKVVKRLDAIRERHSNSRETLTAAQMKRIVQKRSDRFDAFRSLVPRRDELQARLERTGKSWSVGGYAAACAAIALGSAMVAITLGSPALLAILVGLGDGIGLPHLAVTFLAAKRTKQFNTRFPDAIDLLVRGLRSGLPVSESLGVVGREVPDPVGIEFRTISDKIRIGRTMEAAMGEAARRLKSADFQFFVIALAIQRETGGNLAETLGNLSEVLRKRQQMKLKVAAMSSEAKASAYIIGVLPFMIFGIMYTVSPEYVAGFFTDTRLMIAAGVGMCWMSIGAGVMAKMIRFEI